MHSPKRWRSDVATYDVILIELADLRTVAEVINHASGRQIEPVQPRLVESESGWQFRYPQAGPRETSR
jgi:hypothetical protein